jgi:tetratricopeptide (TPR) repeat protein
VEAFAIIQLAARVSRGKRVPAPLLLAGDEAQTIRPTDFEWAWLSDLLHFQVGTPSDYKLAANLRSPRRIAEMVNSVWDLYDHIQKQDRPSGASSAQIDDDDTDQILYCTAAPGPELDALLTSLSMREGLAMINLHETALNNIPAAVRPSVLTVAEAKGLDFHSVCVLDAGRLLDRILHHEWRLRNDSELESLEKRLAIDQLRVALSRPTERLLWVDISPSDKIVRQSISFLNGGPSGSGISSSVPSALLKALEEEELDPEERVLRCQSDARQFLDLKPDLAWSRAQQAVTLLGRPGSPAAITDPAARDAAWLTLAEVCFVLGLRNARLAPELGRPDLFHEAAKAASNARRYGLGSLLALIGRMHGAAVESRLNLLLDLAHLLPQHREEIEPWLAVELESRSKAWVEELESALSSGHNASVLIPALPAFYEALGLPDQTARIARLRQRGIQLLIRDKQFATALSALRALPERQADLEAVCLEGLGDYGAAAACHRAAGNLKEALKCYRTIPDFPAALALIREIGQHPAAESLEWIARLQQVASERPEKFSKTVTTAEKKVLEDILERSLGVTRRKPAVKKAASKSAPRARRTTARKDTRA